MRGFITALFFTAVTTMTPHRIFAQREHVYNIDTARILSLGCDTLRTYPYFSVKGKYPESSQTLAEWADNAMQQQPVPPGIYGYITFRVLIDCRGKLAAIKLLQTNERYEPVQFHRSVVESLYGFVQSLKGWKQALKEGKAVNYFGYLSFKIENSHVVQVAP